MPNSIHSENTPLIWITPITGLASRLASLGKDRTYLPGEILFNQSDPVKNIFLIKQGLVELSIIYTNGTKKTTTNCASGTVLGEMALFHYYTNVNEAIVKKPSVITVLGINEVRDLFFKDPDLAEMLYESLCAKLKLTTHQLGIMMLDSIESRIAHILLDYPGQEILLTHDEIASLVRCSRVSASRHLSRLTKQGLIVNHRGRIIINDREALAELI